MNDAAYTIASEGISNLLDKMLEAGAGFEDSIAELRDQIDTCEADKPMFMES